MGRSTNNKLLLDLLSTFENDDSLSSSYNDIEHVVSRLRLKQEPGGKVRVFAIGDYFTQCSLGGMSDFLFSWLRKQPEDGTFDQDRTTQIAKDWTLQGECVESHDLSAATDRIPIKLQWEIIYQIFNKDIADQWVNLMTNRIFKDPDERDVKYAVGQPMGFKTSFAMLGIFHHLIFRTTIMMAGDKYDRNKHVYIVLGDDSANKQYLAKHYHFLMSVLCKIIINPTKGFTSETYVKGMNPLDTEDGIPSIVEFAKRVFIDGHEVTPVSPVLIKEALEYPMALKNLLIELARRSYPKDSTYPQVVPLAELGFKPAIALTLSSFPLWPAPQLLLPELQGDTPDRDWVTSKYFKENTILKRDSADLKTLTIDHLLGKIAASVEACVDKIGYIYHTLITKAETDVQENGLSFRSQLDLMLDILEYQTSVLLKARKKIWNFETRGSDQSWILILKDFEQIFISIFDIETYLGIRKDKHSTQSDKLSILLKEIVLGISKNEGKLQKPIRVYNMYLNILLNSIYNPLLRDNRVYNKDRLTRKFYEKEISYELTSQSTDIEQTIRLVPYWRVEP
jgi:hypothetical protein